MNDDPVVYYIYALQDKEGKVVYVGCTKNLRQRVREHRYWRSFKTYRILRHTESALEAQRLEKIFQRKYDVPDKQHTPYHPGLNLPPKKERKLMQQHVLQPDGSWKLIQW